MTLVRPAPHPKHPDGSLCFCAGRVLPPPDGRFVPGPMCPISRARGCVCGVHGRDPQQCDTHRVAQKTSAR